MQEGLDKREAIASARSSALLLVWVRFSTDSSHGENEMADIVDELATRTGLSTDMIHKGLGAILSFLKEHLNTDVFQKIQSSVPNASNLVTKYESAPGSSDGGVFGALTDLAGKLLGGKAGEGAKLMESLSKLGFDPAQIEAFLPRALEWIKLHLSPELIQKIMAGLPALAKLAGSGTEQGT
jgi:hypothetical protein